jgi:hypothetical protein
MAVRTALAAIPFAGGAILELVDGLAQRRVQQRLNDVFDSMRERLSVLDEDKVDRVFFHSEEFQTLLFLLLERLHTTHDTDKLRIFGSALANSGSLDFKTDDKEAYIRLLRELSLNDLRTLNDENLKGWFPHTHDIDYAPDVLASLYRLQGMGLVLDKLRVKEVPAGRTGSERLDAQRAISELLTQPPKKTFYLSEFGANFLNFVSVSAV